MTVQKAAEKATTAKTVAPAKTTTVVKPPKKAQPKKAQPKKAQPKKAAVTEQVETLTEDTKDEIVVIKAPKGKKSEKKPKESKIKDEPLGTIQQLYRVDVECSESCFEAYIGAKSINEALAKYYASDKHKENQSSTIRAVYCVTNQYNVFIQ